MDDIFGDNVIIIPPEENIDERGYETTFYRDFSIAERFGDSSIEDTFNRAFNGWKSNCKYLTELVIVLNHKIFDWAPRNEARGRLYEKLWRKAAAYAEGNLKGDELNYYYRKTD